MEVQQFEQAILKMAFETEARITTASVAYYLGIPSQKANELLETLLEQGVLELDSDQEGNLYYFVPNQGDTPSMGPGTDPDDSWERLEAAADDNLEDDPDDQPPAESEDEEPIDPRFVASIDDEDHHDRDEPFSPTEHGPNPGADGDSSTARPAPDGAGNSNPNAGFEADNGPRAPSHPHQEWFQSGDSGGYRTHDDSGADNLYDYGPTAGSRSGSSYQGVPEGATNRMGRTDARAQGCKDDSVVVENAASCENRPLVDDQPTVTSCNEIDSSKFSTHQDYGGFGFTAPDQSTALATTSSSGEMTLTAESHHIEQPEHQPGMALLLSLILCGTGQIYNGEVSKGIIMLILCFLLWFVFLGWVVHIWSIVDAVVVAERINRKSGSGSQAQN